MWLASVRDRSRFLIVGVAAPAVAPKAKAGKAVTAKKAVAKQATVTRKVPAKKAAAKVVAAPVPKGAPMSGATTRALVVREPRVPKRAAKAAGAVDAAVSQAPAEVASTADAT